MPSTLGDDMVSSLSSAMRSLAAFHAGLKDLRDAVANSDWAAVERVRAGLLASVDSYVDHFASAGRRLDHEGAPRGK